MQSIEISDRVLAHLSANAKPFVDTPNSVLERLLGLDGPRSTTPEVRQRSVKPMTSKQAAETILRGEGCPMHYRDIARMAIDEGLWITRGATPDATLNAEISMDISRNGARSTFVRDGRGMYGLREWNEIENGEDVRGPSHQVPAGERATGGQVDYFRALITDRWKSGEQFTLGEVYHYEARFSAKYPDNNSVRPVMRRLLQILRDEGTIEFLGRGEYRVK